ncbi:CAP domain-containing protein [Streptomyces xantholiticus]
MRLPMRFRPSRAVLLSVSGAAVLAAVVAIMWLMQGGGQAPDDPGTAVIGQAPTPVETPPPPAVGRAVRSDVGRVVDLVNAERAKAGCPRMTVSRQLEEAAQVHADDMAARGYYEHSGLDGRDGGDRMSAAGYGWSRWAENLHKGPTDPRAVVAGWMRSPTHRAGILDCRLKDMGVAVNYGSGGPWWVQALGTRHGPR